MKCNVFPLLLALFVATQVVCQWTNFRVSPGMGSRGQAKFVRISVADNAANQRSAAFRKAFSYIEPFQYRWTNLTLYSNLNAVTPGATNAIKVGNTTYNVFVPSPGAGVRGLLVGDPCFSANYDKCMYGIKDILDIKTRLPALMNAILAHKSAVFFGILGDNFYDADASMLADEFFSGVDQEVQEKLFITVPGNADFWQKEQPAKMAVSDSFANGFMQYYGQDTPAAISMAAKGVNAPYDFSVNPNHGHPSNYSSFLPAPDNFNFFHSIGNIAWIGFSNTYTWKTLQNFFEGACTWIDKHSDTIDWIFVVAHWSVADKGCVPGSDTATIYSKVIQLPGCRKKAAQTKYFMGHTHCNRPDKANPQSGWIIGGFGKNHGDSCEDFGIPFIDTINSESGSAGTKRLEILYYPIVDYKNGTHRGTKDYKAVLQCAQSSGGLPSCKHLAVVWLNQTLPKK